MEITILAFALLIPVIFLLILFGWLMPVSLIISAAAAKVQVTPLDLIGMRFRGVNPHTVVKAVIRLKQAGIEPEPDKPGNQPQPEKYDGNDEEMLDLIRIEAFYHNPPTLHRLEAHQLAGGNPDQVANGLIEAKKRKISLAFKDACSIDIGGGNVIRVVAALEEARKRNVELDIDKAISIELALSKNSTGSSR